MLNTKKVDLIKMYNQIIEEKGKSEVSFQKEIIVKPEYQDPDLPVVIGVGTGGGKTTLTTIKLEMFYRNPKNRGKKTIILSSSTKVLRKNFAESIEEFNPTFTYRSVANRKEFKQAVDDGIEVIIVLPQTLNNIKDLPKVEWLVVDEAHKWYFAKTIQEKIIPRCKPTYQWLLTGTPFKFTAANVRNKKYHIHYVSVSQMMDLGRVGNPNVSIITTDYDIKHSDYFQNVGEVRRTLNFGYKTHKSAFTKMVKEMLKCVKNPLKTITQRDLYQHVFGELDKTIVYCYSKQQARAFHKVCKSLGVNTLCSDSENDIDSTKFDSFKTNKDIKVLFVVDRGREGFDMPELFNIVDFTLSINPEVILQIMGRVLRLSFEQPNKTKQYFKISPANDVYYHKVIMTGVLQLICDEAFETFTGKIDQIKVPTGPRKPKSQPEGPRGPKGDNGPNLDPISYFSECNIPLTVGWWKEISTKHTDAFKTVCWTSINDIRKEWFGTYNEWTDDKIQSEALKYEDLNQLQKCEEGIKLYNVIRKLSNEKYQELAPHLYKYKRKRGGLTREECKVIVSTWKVLPSRSKGSSKKDIKVYARIKDRKWDDLLKDVPRTKRGQKTKRTDEEVRREARRRHWMIKKGLTEEQWLEKENKRNNNFTLNKK